MDEATVRLKALTMLELLGAHYEPYERAIMINYWLPTVEEQVRKFYREHGQYPDVWRDPGGHGHGIVVGIKHEMESDETIRNDYTS